jgi:hypothetical protein
MLVAGAAGEGDAEVHQDGRIGLVQAERGKAVEGGLVRRAGRDLRPGVEELAVRAGDRVRVVGEEPSRPEVGGEVVAAGLEKRGQATVEDDDVFGDRLAEVPQTSTPV